MYESVIISIHPNWWKRIVSGEKKIELRKTFPTNIGGDFRVLVHVSGIPGIVGQFDCPAVKLLKEKDYLEASYKAIVSVDYMKLYSGGKNLYGWEIDNPIEYDEAKPLDLFGIARAPQSWCYVY